MNALRTAADYELFVYTLSQQFPAVRRSTLRFVRLGATLARVVGEVHFDEDVRLVVRQRIVYDRLPAVIDAYGYEVWRGGSKLYWYDCQPHPGDLELQSTSPHHKHVPPDIKHHRLPAPEMSFSAPNLPALIREIDALVSSFASARSPG
jgi:hypothetical protein